MFADHSFRITSDPFDVRPLGAEEGSHFHGSFDITPNRLFVNKNDGYYKMRGSEICLYDISNKGAKVLAIVKHGKVEVSNDEISVVFGPVGGSSTGPHLHTSFFARFDNSNYTLALNPRSFPKRKTLDEVIRRDEDISSDALKAIVVNYDDVEGIGTDPGDFKFRWYGYTELLPMRFRMCYMRYLILYAMINYGSLIGLNLVKLLICVDILFNKGLHHKITTNSIHSHVRSISRDRRSMLRRIQKFYGELKI